MEQRNGRSEQLERDIAVMEFMKETTEQMGKRWQGERKRRSPYLLLCIIFAMVTAIAIFANADMQRQLQQEKKDSAAKIAEMEERQQELKSEKERIVTEKSELVSENKELQSNIQSLNTALKEQLLRKNLLQDTGEVVEDLPVFVNAEESIPLIGYLQDSKKKAKKTPLLLTNRENKKGFYSLKIAFLKEENSKVEIWQSKKFNNLDISEEGGVLIPLLDDKINLLKITKGGEEYYLAMKWENHVE